jgi:hypothetical protein
MNQLLDRKTPTAPARFTAKQGQYLAFIWAYTQINRRAPAEADFQRYFKVTAPSVHQMQLGLIEKQPGPCPETPADPPSRHFATSVPSQ